MKASKIIALLQKEIDMRGDKEVEFYGAYGARTNVFEIATKDNIGREWDDYIWVFVDIFTG